MHGGYIAAGMSESDDWMHRRYGRVPVKGQEYPRVVRHMAAYTV